MYEKCNKASGGKQHIRPKKNDFLIQNCKIIEMKKIQRKRGSEKNLTSS